MNESDFTVAGAKAALAALGIKKPSRQLVQDWLRANSAQEPELRSVELAGEGSRTAPPSALPNSAPERTERPHPSSESNLEPLLRDRGEVVRERGPRRAGRPREQAPWFACVASVMSDGSTPLRAALARCGVDGLTQKELRSLYRNTALLAMRREARQKYIREWGVNRRKPARRWCKGCFPIGISPQLRRIL